MSEKRLILVVEDERTISNFICRALSASDYKPLAAASGKEGLSLFFSHGPDLVLLDLGLPDMDGLEVLSQLRGLPREVPVIIISARDRESEKVKALDMGADDYVVKPFGVPELLARIRAALRKRGSGERPEEPLLSAGPLTMDVERHTVAVSGTPVELTRREFDLLHHLLENKGRVLSREALLDSVWGFDFVGETNSVDVYIRFLRSKLDEAFGIKLIHTVRGVGYVIREN